MKKLLAACLLFALLCACLPAFAKGPEYTLSKKYGTVLQNIPDREIPLQVAGRDRDPIAGESPVTGLPWEGRYLPMLAQIGNDVNTDTVNGYTVQSAGIGKRTPWGIQYADILYEEALSRSGYTRFTMLFSDCFAQNEPAAGIGPLRSCRMGPMMLREEWQGGLAYGGAMVGSFRWTDERMAWLYTDSIALEWNLLINTKTEIYNQVGYPVRGVKMPNNYNAYLIDIRNMISDAYIATPHPFLFKDNDVWYSDSYAPAGIISLDWGYKYNISHFIYDSAENVYYRYCGAGIKPKKWVLFTAFPTAEDREDEGRIPIPFANVIVQRVTYTYIDGSDVRSVIQSVGQGNAELFIDGRYIPGYWSRASIHDPTVFYDDHGNELIFNRGKTYIAQFPAEGLCLFTDGE